MTSGLSRQPHGPTDGFENDQVQALSLLLGSVSQHGVQRLWDVSNGVLHALSIGNAGITCNRTDDPTPRGLAWSYGRIQDWESPIVVIGVDFANRSNWVQ